MGRLGGRPKKDVTRTKVLSLRLTLDEYETLLEKSQKQNLHIAHYCRTILNEKPFPNVKQNKLLLQYAVNFTRISNFMKQGIFNEFEKQYLLDEIQTLITQLRKAVKW